MAEIQEGSLLFTFDAATSASKYDDWSFYRNQFQNACFRNNKAVDILCKSDRVTWLIEIKDYRQHARTKSVDLADEIAIKVRDSLAGILAAKTQANDSEEKDFARKLVLSKQFRVVCHIEQPAKSSRLRPRAIEPDDLKDTLRRLIKAIDPHPIVMDKDTSGPTVPWNVSRRNP
ncbi:hypothetical protein ThidrDRAFT_4086 [Thiorhodococcus drewsii AZ1]|uniref:Cysteinyl-tRNA synthetase n=1 Tax=Thiorhodococcus drewsii AZ1 TaxID=765913 RepID=G2E723_9GAMM|nr:hypothetical protein [Thiorhodococcus drewsii]EGV28123.1 hypothetical protein ThidrDRAFT_4086 [Thiorhodococcus drewsii AZ1]